MLIESEKKNAAEVKEKIMTLLKGVFKPEFLNRVDDIIIFNRLTTKEIGRIVDIQIEHIKNILSKKSIVLNVNPEAREKLAREGYDPQFGARPLKRLLQKELLDKIALLMLEGKFIQGSKILAFIYKKTGAINFKKE